MHIDYHEPCAEKTQQLYKKRKVINNHYNNHFYEKYILALRERHRYDVRNFSNESNLCAKMWL